MIIALPIEAPKTRSQNILIFEDIFQEPLKKQVLIKYQRALLIFDPGLYQSLLYVDKSHCIEK